MILLDKDGQLFLQGHWAIQDTASLIKQLSTITAQQNLMIDVNQVEKANSILLAILITLQRRARKKGCTLTYVNWPHRLLSLIDLYSLHDLLGLSTPHQKIPQV